MLAIKKSHNENHLQTFVTPSSLPERIKWFLMRLLLSTIGLTSEGIRIGYTFGFDSGTMLDYIYRNEAHGSLGIGRLIDRSYLEAIGWRAIRARRVLLKHLLKQEVEHRRPSGQRVRLLDVAAGPGRYLQELALECEPQRNDLLILCRDLALPGLMQGAKQAEQASLQNIFFERGNALEPTPVDAILGGAPHIIVVSGLYELLLDDQVIKDSHSALYAARSRRHTLLYNPDPSSPARLYR